jgi:hypothetical protein
MLLLGNRRAEAIADQPSRHTDAHITPATCLRSRVSRQRAVAVGAQDAKRDGGLEQRCARALQRRNTQELCGHNWVVLGGSLRPVHVGVDNPNRQWP